MIGRAGIPKEFKKWVKSERIISEEFKAKAASGAIKGMRVLSELDARYQVDTTQLGQWIKQLVENAPRLLERERWGAVQDAERTRR